MKNCQKQTKEENKIYQNLNDSTTFYKDKLGRNHAEYSILQGEKANLLLNIKTKDSTIIELQKLVKDNKSNLSNGGDAVIVHTKDTITKSTITTIIPLKDSCDVEYTTSYRDKWLDYKIQAKKDTTLLKLELTNQYSVIIGSKRDKWYQKKKAFVDVVNDNPYDKIKTVRAYQVEDKSKTQRIIIGLQIGYGITKSGFSPYGGIGITYKLFGL